MNDLPAGISGGLTAYDPSASGSTAPYDPSKGVGTGALWASRRSSLQRIVVDLALCSWLSSPPYTHIKSRTHFGHTIMFLTVAERCLRTLLRSLWYSRHDPGKGAAETTFPHSVILRHSFIASQGCCHVCSFTMLLRWPCLRNLLSSESFNFLPVRPCPFGDLVL